jgi:hypothetical protein
MQICILKRISEELRKGCKSGRKEHLVMSHETGGFSAAGKGGQVDVQIRAISLVGFQAIIHICQPWCPFPRVVQKSHDILS